MERGEKGDQNNTMNCISCGQVTSAKQRKLTICVGNVDSLEETSIDNARKAAQHTIVIPVQLCNRHSCRENVRQMYQTWTAALNSGSTQILVPSKWRCQQCQQSADTIKVCGKCKSARFCSVECQRDNWPEHRKVCVAKKL